MFLGDECSLLYAYTEYPRLSERAFNEINKTSVGLVV